MNWAKGPPLGEQSFVSPLRAQKTRFLAQRTLKKDQKTSTLDTNPTEDGAMEVYPGDRGAQELGERCEN